MLPSNMPFLLDKYFPEIGSTIFTNSGSKEEKSRCQQEDSI